MCTLRIPLFVLLLALVAVGCDSNDDEDDDNGGATDRELFIGSWVLEGITDGSGEAIEVPDEVSLSIVFQEDSTSILILGEDLVNGTYEIDEGEDQLAVTIPEEEVALLTDEPIEDDVVLSFEYSFEEDGTVSLTPIGLTPFILSGVLEGVTLTGEATITLRREASAAA